MTLTPPPGAGGPDDPWSASCLDGAHHALCGGCACPCHVDPSRVTTVHVDHVPYAAITDTLLAIELCRERGVYDDEQIARLTPLVLGLRAAGDTRPQADR